MKTLMQKRKAPIFLLVFAGLIGSLTLAACSGTAFVDFSYDPTQGVGNIVITGDQDQPPQQQQDNMSQILLFGLILAMLLGTIAIVISVARRPR
jgi:hypothetical protein